MKASALLLLAAIVFFHLPCPCVALRPGVGTKSNRTGRTKQVLQGFFKKANQEEVRKEKEKYCIEPPQIDEGDFEEQRLLYCRAYLPWFLLLLNTKTDTTVTAGMILGISHFFTLVLFAIVMICAYLYGPKTKPSPPKYWITPSINRFNDNYRAEVDVTSELEEIMQQLLDSTTKAIGVGRDGKWATHKGLKVTKVVRIENGHLWTKYANTLDSVRPVEEKMKRMTDTERENAYDALGKIKQVHADRDLKCSAFANFVRGLQLDESRNERLLFHGSPHVGARNEAGEILYQTEDQSPLYAIKAIGFDERLGSVKGMYGSGTYFADMASKADQYAGMYNPPGSPNGSVGETAAMFLARVTLGTPYSTAKSLEGLRRPPCVHGHFDMGLLFNDDVSIGTPWRDKDLSFQICNHDRFDSVMGDLTIDGQKKLYREYIVYDNQSYPEFLIYYERTAQDTL
jgi:hypothetical protein